jgi:hypothetical protein
MSRRTKSIPILDHFEVEGNNGGSYVLLTRSETPGMVHLQVGETCIRTIDQQISVVALAAILTAAKDRGFQTVVDEYIGYSGGTPVMSVEHDL